MSDLRAKLVFEAIDRLTQPINRMTSRIRQRAQQMSRAFAQVGETAMRVGRSIEGVGQNLALRLTAPLGALGFASLKTAGDIEKLNIKFGSLLQSTDKANVLVKDLVNFTANTPFQLQGVSEASVKLLTAGVATEDLTDRLSVLGDIAALADASMGDLGTIYSRVRSQQVAYTMELEMLSDRGVPIWQELARMTGKSVG